MRQLREVIAPLVLLASVTLSTYWPVLRNGFVNFDDDLYVTKNSHVLSGLTSEGIRWAFKLTHGETGFYWHPLTWLSLMLDRELYGQGPRGFHLTNLLLHTANAMLLYLLLLRLTRAPWRSAGVVLLFALHPLNVESVAWVVERKQLLCVLLGLAALGSYARYAARPGVLRYIPVALLLALSLMAKPLFVTLPFLLLLIDVWPLGRSSRRMARLALEKVPLLLLVAASIVITLRSGIDARLGEVAAPPPIGLRIGNAVASYVDYVTKLLLPLHLAVFYPYPEAVGTLNVVASSLALLGASVAAIVLRRKAPALLVGWFWFAGTLVPTLGILQMGLWPAMADRFVYFPMIGVLIALAWGLPQLAPRLRSFGNAGLVTTALVAVCFATASRRQIRVWKDSLSLYAQAITMTRDNDVAHNNLAGTYLDMGQAEQALLEYRKALAIRPGKTEARIGIARALQAKGKSDEARAELLALARDEPFSPKAFLDLGNLDLAAGRLDAAIASYERAAASSPFHAGAHCNLGEAYRREGRFEEAREQLELARRLDADLELVYRPLAAAYESLRRPAQALECWERVLLLHENDADIHLRVGTLLGETGRVDEAVSHLEVAVRLDPKSAEARSNLGSAYLLKGMPHEAVACYLASIELDPANAEAHYDLSLAYRATGQTMKAMAELDVARSLNPALSP